MKFADTTPRYTMRISLQEKKCFFVPFKLWKDTRSSRGIVLPCIREFHAAQLIQRRQDIFFRRLKRSSLVICVHLFLPTYFIPYKTWRFLVEKNWKRALHMSNKRREVWWTSFVKWSHCRNRMSLLWLDVSSKVLQWSETMFSKLAILPAFIESYSFSSDAHTRPIK